MSLTPLVTTVVPALSEGAGHEPAVSPYAIGIGTSTSFGSAEAVLAMANVTTAPTSLGFQGGILYVRSGHLWFLGAGGTVTQVASA